MDIGVEKNYHEEQLSSMSHKKRRKQELSVETEYDHILESIDRF